MLEANLWPKAGPEAKFWPENAPEGNLWPKAGPEAKFRPEAVPEVNLLPKAGPEAKFLARGRIRGKFLNGATIAFAEPHSISHSLIIVIVIHR
jgi:hypothetical protein